MNHRCFDIQMLNTFGKRGPIARLAIAGMVYGPIELTPADLSHTAAIGLGVVATGALPASVAIMPPDESVLKVVSPATWRGWFTVLLFGTSPSWELSPAAPY